MLSTGASSKPTEFVETVQACAARGIPFVIGECNSASCGGQSGVSDRFASALWSLSFMATASKTGVQGMYFHGGPHGAYAAIAYDNATSTVPEVRPLYYGMYAFAFLIRNGGRWVQNTTVTLQNGTSTVDASNGVAADPSCSNGVRAGDVCCAKSCGVCGGTGCNDRPGGSAGCCSGVIARANLSCSDHDAPCVLTDDAVPVEAFSLHVPGASQVRTLVVAKSTQRGDMGRDAGAVWVEVCLPSRVVGDARVRLLLPLCLAWWS